MASPEQLDAVVAAVLSARKYRDVDREVVRRLAAHALGPQGHAEKQAVERVKRALHQAYGAFGGGALPYARMLRQLQSIAGEDRPARQAALLSAMRHHSSTRERAPEIEPFYAAVFDDGVPARVLDLGCGLNGLSIPFWPAPPAQYHGIDLDSAMLDFVAWVLATLGIRCSVGTADLLGDTPLPSADLALVMKLYPTLEQQQAGSGTRLLERIDAPRIVLSFPTGSLGRHKRGMTDTYRQHFADLMATRGWHWRERVFASELVYLVER